MSKRWSEGVAQRDWLLIKNIHKKFGSVKLRSFPKTRLIDYFYYKLIKKSDPDFIHVKGFKSLGYSRNRMGYDKQPFHKEVKSFGKKLLKELKSWDKNWKIIGPSLIVERTVLLENSRSTKE
jgi:hypothetical protein